MEIQTVESRSIYVPYVNKVLNVSSIHRDEQSPHFSKDLTAILCSLTSCSPHSVVTYEIFDGILSDTRKILGQKEFKNEILGEDNAPKSTGLKSAYEQIEEQYSSLKSKIPDRASFFELCLRNLVFPASLSYPKPLNSFHSSDLKAYGSVIKSLRYEQKNYSDEQIYAWNRVANAVFTANLGRDLKSAYERIESYHIPLAASPELTSEKIRNLAAKIDNVAFVILGGTGMKVLDSLDHESLVALKISGLGLGITFIFFSTSIGLHALATHWEKRHPDR